MLQVGDLTSEERAVIEDRIAASGRPMEDVLSQAATLLSGLSRCAGLLVAAKQESSPQARGIRRHFAGRGACHRGRRRWQRGKPLIDDAIGLPPRP
jgi:heat-inducible transcriptional repressor